MPVGRLRRAAVVLAIGLVVLLAASLGLALYGDWRLARATERFEATLGSSDLERFMRPELPAAENAATWLQAGAAAIVVSEERHDFDRLRARGDAPWDEETTGLARRFVEDNAPALELLRRAAACAGSSYEIDYQLGPRLDLPPLVDLLRASWLLSIDGRLALVDGDPGRLRLDLATLDRLAGSLAEESLLITALLALAVDRQHLHLVHRLVTGGGEAPLAEIEAVLAGRDRQAAFLRALTGDGSMLPRSSGWMVQRPGGGPLGWARRQLARPAEKLLLATLLDEYSAIGDLAAMPWPEVVAASEARIAAGFRRFFAVSLYPNLIDGVGKLKAGQSVARLALEAVRYRRALLETGSYPPARPPWIDPYTGEEVLVERLPDGTVRLEAVGAADRWRSSHSRQSLLGDHRFTWDLPAAPGAAP